MLPPRADRRPAGIHDDPEPPAAHCGPGRTKKPSSMRMKVATHTGEERRLQDRFSSNGIACPNSRYGGDDGPVRWTGPGLGGQLLGNNLSPVCGAKVPAVNQRLDLRIVVEDRFGTIK